MTASGANEDSGTHDQGLNELLAAYACGRLAMPAWLLVTAHLEMSPRNRAYVSSLECLCGQAVEAVKPASFHCRERMLKEIFSCKDKEAGEEDTLKNGGAKECVPAHKVSAYNPQFPQTLCALIKAPIEKLSFATIAPGLRECRLGETEGCVATLISISPGHQMPRHHHEGVEIGLVLEGGFCAGDGCYKAGDILISDRGVDHWGLCDTENDCLCLLVREASVPRSNGTSSPLAPFLLS